jgi:molecular chaperone Hsp33
MNYTLKTTCDFVREKNVFLIHVDLSQYLLEYYVYRKDFAEVVTRFQDNQLKDLISSFAIHLTASIGTNSHAWTVTLISNPPYSLFVTGANGEPDKDGISKGYIVGNVLLDHIRSSDTNAISAQSVIGSKTTNSFVATEESEIYKIVEAYYNQSEQRPIKISISENSDTAIGIVALPDFDEQWFESVEVNSFFNEAKTFDTVRMRTCEYVFECSCSVEKLLPFFQALSVDEIEDWYQDDEQLIVNCPRCGKSYIITRAMVTKN